MTHSEIEVCKSGPTELYCDDTQATLLSSIHTSIILFSLVMYRKNNYIVVEKINRFYEVIL